MDQPKHTLGVDCDAVSLASSWCAMSWPRWATSHTFTSKHLPVPEVGWPGITPTDTSKHPSDTICKAGVCSCGNRELGNSSHGATGMAVTASDSMCHSLGAKLAAGGPTGDAATDALTCGEAGVPCTTRDVDRRRFRPPCATATAQTTLALYTGDPRLAARSAMGHARSVTTEPRWARAGERTAVSCSSLTMTTLPAVSAAITPPCGNPHAAEMEWGSGDTELRPWTCTRRKTASKRKSQAPGTDPNQWNLPWHSEGARKLAGPLMCSHGTHKAAPTCTTSAAIQVLLVQKTPKRHPAAHIWQAHRPQPRRPLVIASHGHCPAAAMCGRAMQAFELGE